MSALHFSSVIEIYNGNPYVLVTAEQAATLKEGWHKPMPVIIQINKQPNPPWHINMMPIGDGNFYLYLHGDVRRASRTKVGDTVAVSVRFDEAYKNGPQHPMPDWFRTPLHANKHALAAWEALPPSRQKEVLRYFSWLKSDDARQRNVDKAMRVLSGAKDRFMGRDWDKGR